MSAELDGKIIEGLSVGILTDRFPGCVMSYIDELSVRHTFLVTLCAATTLNGSPLVRAEHGRYLDGYLHSILKALVTFDDPDNYGREAELALAAIYALEARGTITKEARRKEIQNYLFKRWGINDAPIEQDAFDEWERGLSIKQATALNKVHMVYSLFRNVLVPESERD